MAVASPGQPQKSSSQATTALVMGILSFLCCGIFAPIAWYLGNREIKAIQAGASPVSGEGIAKAAMILGIIGTIYLAIAVFWIFFMGGMAILSAMFNH